MDWLFIVIGALIAVWLASLLLKIGGRLIHLILMIVLVIFFLRLFGIL